MKLLFTLILALLCTSFSKAAGEPKGIVNVNNAEAFIAAIKADNAAHIKLTGDIALGVLSEPICDTFKGSIDGGYQAIDPKTGELQDFVYAIFGSLEGQSEWASTELFTKADSAEFRDVLFANIFVNTSNHSQTGLIAREVKDSKFFNIVFDKVKVSCNNDDAGVIAGHAERCLFGVVTTKACDVYTAGIHSGGLVGNSDHCKFEFSINNPTTRVYADGRFTSGGAYAGGFCGLSSHDTFMSCINAAIVGTAEDNVGGFTGKSLYSDFISCENSGYIAQSRHDLFLESADLAQQRIESFINSEDFSTSVGLAVMGASIGTAVVVSAAVEDIAYEICQASFNYFDGLTVYNPTWYTKMIFSFSKSYFNPWKYARNGMLFRAFDEMGLINEHYMTGANLAGYASVVLKPLAIILAIEAAATVAWHFYEGDDETGGISAQAQGGTFEQCSNLGALRCKDDDCGGIVGLGYGVTINNCFNSGSAQWDEDDTTGSILGKSMVDSDNGNKPCLVTNCLSTWSFHIVGDESIAAGLDPASGNNYRMEGGKGNSVNCEMPINQQQLESGLVAMWLNQGIQNTRIGDKPWKQNLVVEADSLRDKRPFLSVTHADVSIETLRPANGVSRIKNADDLMAFAKKVNEEDQFACAVLDADIDMTGKPWTPIGKDGFTTNFRGIFDGRGHTISGLKCESDKAVGLFGTVHTGAEIRNVIIGEDCEFTGTGNSGVGAIVGEVPIGWKWGNVVIENCGNYGKITAKNTVNAGGILGLVRNNTVDAVKVFVNNCFHMGTVTAENGNSALLCGYMRNSGVVTNCWSGGKLLSSTDKMPFDTENARGDGEFFIGYYDKYDIENCFIADPYNSVDYRNGYIAQWGVEFIYNDCQLTSGEITYLLNGKTNDVESGLAWQQHLGTDLHPVLGSKGLYHQRHLIKKNYGTVCVPYALQSDRKIEYFLFKEVKTDGDEVQLCFEYTSEVAPATPALYHVVPNGTYDFVGPVESDCLFAPGSTEPSDWTMVGTFDEKMFDGDAAKIIYYITNDANENASIKNARKVTIAPFRAYFTGPNIDTLIGDSTPARLSIVIDGEETGLHLVVNDRMPSQSSKSYTLYGTEATDGYHGVVITNGQKVMR